MSRPATECSYCGRFHAAFICPGCGALWAEGDEMASWESWDGPRKTGYINGVDHFSEVYRRKWNPTPYYVEWGEWQ